MTRATLLQRLVAAAVATSVTAFAGLVACASAAVIEIDGGLQVKSDDGANAIGVGGRIQSDWSFMFESHDLPAELASPDGTEFRRARINVDGVLHTAVFFKSQWDFAGGAAEPKDVYAGVTNVPLFQTVRVGKQFEPFSLDELTSSNHLVFLERAMPSGFAPSRQPAIQAYGTIGEGGGTWALGISREDSESDGTGLSTGAAEYAQTVRVTARPRAGEDGGTLIHAGVAASQRVPQGRSVSYAFRPEIHLARTLISTGPLPADRVLLLGAEGALVSGSLSLQGELIAASVDGGAGGTDPTFLGYYAFASLFVTGESRSYQSSSATFGRVKPRRNVGESKGAGGALELAARVSRVDLDDPGAGVDGGTLTNVTLGANWYLNPNAKVAANLVRGTFADVAGAFAGAAVRFHVDF